MINFVILLALIPVFVGTVLVVLTRIVENRTERLEIIPAQPEVVLTIRPKYACPKKQGGIVQAVAPVHLIEGGLPTEGILAHIRQTNISRQPQ